MDSDSRISLRDVSFTYDEAPAPALSNVSAAIRAGEFVAVPGQIENPYLIHSSESGFR